MTIDYQRLFISLPGNYLILLPDSKFTIVEVSDSYRHATMTQRDIIGRGLFEVFPDNPDDPNATGVTNLTASLNRVLKNKAIDQMAIQKYDIPRPEVAGGGFEERYWKPQNSPVFNENGNISLIVHNVVDVTKTITLEKEKIDLTEKLREINEKLSKKVIELEKLNYFMIDRETKMASLKREIHDLKKRIEILEASQK